MKKKRMALCDGEQDYVQYLTEYLKAREDLPFEIYGYTDPEKLVQFGQCNQIDLLVMAERVFRRLTQKVPAGRTMILKESDEGIKEGLPQICKYQRAENIYRFIMEQYLEVADSQEEGESGVNPEQVTLIGMYSPVRRCLQTSFALTLGQLLGAGHRTLYISFEHYSGWNRMLKQEGGRDLSDLLCHVEEPEEKFRHRLRLAQQKIGDLFYIPPVFAGQNLIYVRAGEWKRLVEKIAATGDYRYIILDLSESLQGIFELLRLCSRVYTLVREDEVARNKLLQYEQLLRLYEFEDVLEKTQKHTIPGFRELPPRLDQFTKGELAAFVQKIAKEDLLIQHVEF